MRSLAAKLVALAAIAVLYARPTPSWAAAKTCLTGTDSAVASDLSQITAVRSLIGLDGKTVAPYVRGVRGL
jgi:hypothetical protein